VITVLVRQHEHCHDVEIAAQFRGIMLKDKLVGADIEQHHSSFGADVCRETPSGAQALRSVVVEKDRERCHETSSVQVQA